MIPRTYGDRLLLFTRAEYDGVVCQMCDGKKSRKVGLCYRCAAIASGRPIPGVSPARPHHIEKLALGRLWLLALRDAGYPLVYHAPNSVREHWRDKDRLLLLAAGKSDMELLSQHNLGRKSLQWIRANQPLVSVGYQGDPLWGLEEMA